MKKFVVLLIVLSLFVFGNQFVFSQENPIIIGKSKSGKVETVLGYLHVYPEDLGKFKRIPINVIKEVNRQSLNGYNNWRLPTEEELSLMYANGEMLGLKGRNYMTRENQNDDKEYYVRLVHTNNKTPMVEQPIIGGDALYKSRRDGGSGSGLKTVIEKPKPNMDDAYRKGGGTGSGSGNGSVGPGTGSGYGSGIEYGTGNRGYTHMPDFTIPITGQVYVEVHVDTEGNVVEARVINNSKYPTTITNPQILADCVASAKTAKYRPGKEELRIIVFN